MNIKPVQWIKDFINWLSWCIEFKALLPWSVSLVSRRELTEEEYNFPKDFIEGMEKIVEAVETTDFDMDKVEEVINVFGKISDSAKQVVLDMDKVSKNLSHERPCSYCGEVYSTLMCPCVVEQLKENNTHHILCNLDPRLPVDECRQCIGFYKEALDE